MGYTETAAEENRQKPPIVKRPRFENRPRAWKKQPGGKEGIMKISIEEKEALDEAEILIRCQPGQAPRLLALLEKLDLEPARKLAGRREGQTYVLEPEDVLYIESVDKKTFLYTAGEVYETDLRLYELETMLRDKDFFRASKPALVNFNGIRSLRPDLGGRLRLTMMNGEAVYVSRQYAPALKKRLGI